MTNDKQDGRTRKGDLILGHMRHVLASYEVNSDMMAQELTQYHLTELAKAKEEGRREGARTKRCLILAMEDILDRDPILKVDIYGMVFYRDTGIWPLFKSAPVGMYIPQTDKERQESYDMWIKQLSLENAKDIINNKSE